MREIFYGGDGVKERTEYRSLTGEELYLKALDSSVMIESLFDEGHSFDTFKSQAWLDSKVLERELTLSYLVFDKTIDDIHFYDNKTNQTLLLEGTSTCYEKDVSIRHTVFKEGATGEEYFVSFERKIPRTDVAFFHTFLIEIAKGGSANITVSGNNIDTDDTFVTGNFFERQLSGYDFHEFTKEINEVLEHINAARIEHDIDRRLAKHLQ